jgi:hypothetical protein
MYLSSYIATHVNALLIGKKEELVTSLDGLSGHVSGSFEENYVSLRQISLFTDRYIVVGVERVAQSV